MTIHQKIREDIKGAMKAKETEKLTVLRGILSAFMNESVNKGRKPDEELGDEEALAVISRAVKQRKDSIEQFEKGGRSDLAETEKSELAILAAFLPEQMSREEVETFVQGKIAEAGEVDKAKLGQFIGTIMKDLKGKADGGMVKEVVEGLVK